ncbi:MAG: hypothetical protein ACHP7E_06180 [Burkholderiales bacterium]
MQCVACSAAGLPGSAPGAARPRVELRHGAGGEFVGHGPDGIELQEEVAHGRRPDLLDEMRHVLQCRGALQHALDGGALVGELLRVFHQLLVRIELRERRRRHVQHALVAIQLERGEQLLARLLSHPLVVGAQRHVRLVQLRTLEREVEGQQQREQPDHERCGRGHRAAEDRVQATPPRQAEHAHRPDRLGQRIDLAREVGGQFRLLARGVQALRLTQQLEHATVGRHASVPRCVVGQRLGVEQQVGERARVHGAPQTSTPWNHKPFAGQAQRVPAGPGYTAQHQPCGV